MTSLILHIGPPKCGSSSIQQFFARNKTPCVQKVHYRLLDPSIISELNHEKPGGASLTTFTQLLTENLTGCDALILSHEYLFGRRYAIRNICNLAKEFFTDISIIGYSRRQSELVISSYSQWGFRSPDRAKEAAILLGEFELEPVLFSGLEQRLIAFILNDFDVRGDGNHSSLGWHHPYNETRQLTRGSGAVVKCGVLPRKESGNSLIQDFCDKSGLTLRPEMEDVSRRIFNQSFDPDIIEAINNAVAFGLEMPGPNESNEALVLLSNKMVKPEDNSSGFLSNLKSYIDTFFFSSNQQFCQEYGLDETYFIPSARFSKDEILELVKHENQQRALNKSMVINNYRMLSARMIELCLKLINEQDYRRNQRPARTDPKPKPSGMLRKLLRR